MFRGRVWMDKDKITFICPTCGKKVSVERVDELPTRPFCCYRCKMIDLYRWLNEEYYISEIILNKDDIKSN